ncbi:hypothetical protein LguiA_032659 [Lonicera macranthoides]
MQPRHLSDSAPLWMMLNRLFLTFQNQNLIFIRLITSPTMGGHELDRHIKNKNQKVEEDDVQSFNDTDPWL